MKKGLLVLVCCLGVVVGAMAQSTSIFVDSLKIIPSNPTQNDSITFIAYTAHPYTGDGLYDKRIIITDTIVNIYSCWISGPLPAYDYKKDSSIIGKFALGNYKIRFILKFLLPWELDSVEPCLTNPYYDSTFLNFTVSSVNSISTSINENDFHLSPNPASNTVNISIDESMLGSTLTVTDITGRKMAAVQLQTTNNKLETTNLSTGIYFISISNGAQSATRKLVISH